MKTRTLVAYNYKTKGLAGRVKTSKVSTVTVDLPFGTLTSENIKTIGGEIFTELQRRGIKGLATVELLSFSPIPYEEKETKKKTIQKKNKKEPQAKVSKK